MMKKLKEVAVASLAIMGLVLAGSDGPYFPWLNWFGVGILAAVAYGIECHQSGCRRSTSLRSYRRSPWIAAKR
jgi:hypothetical protein